MRHRRRGGGDIRRGGEPRAAGRAGEVLQVDQAIDVILLDIGKEQTVKIEPRRGEGRSGGVPDDARRKAAMRSFVIVQRQTKLLKVVLAARAAGGFAGRLHGRQQQRDKNADDGDHNEQLNKRETM